MKIIAPLIVVLSLLFSLSESTEKILCGRTGNGKSYIATILGCISTTCDDEESCTKEIKSCPNGMIDTVGLDDDGAEYEVTYNGKNIKLSGYTYPIWALFEHLEKEKLSDVEFYLVSDAGNIKAGQSSKLFMDFVKNDLKCSVNTVLNKYRDYDAAHTKLKNKFDILIPYEAKQAVLNGKSCTLSLSAAWREKLIMSDLKGVISTVSIENCKKLKKRLDEFNAVMSQQPKAISTSSCGYDKVVGTYKTGNDWHVSLGPISFGGGGGEATITERAVDEDCARKQQAINDAIRTESAGLYEQKVALVSTIESIEGKVAECKTLLANWAEL